MSNSQEPRLARAAAMIADPARSRMLSYLLAGQYASAGELARAGSVTAPTASAHLGKLLASGFVICEARGRHRYYRLADAEIAHALEALALVAERAPAERYSLICCKSSTCAAAPMVTRSPPAGKPGFIAWVARRRHQDLAAGSPMPVWTGRSDAIIWPAAWPTRCSITSSPGTGCAATSCRAR